MAVLGIGLALVMAVAPVSRPSSAGLLQIHELAMPLTVKAGDNISFFVNGSSNEWYLYASGDSFNAPLVFTGSHNDSDWFGGRQNAFQMLTWLKVGRWNLSFESSGRISIAKILSQVCGWSPTAENLDGFSCSAIRVNETTAFAFYYTYVEHPYVLRIHGDADAFFFDNALSPLGQANEMRYEARMIGVVIVVPHDGSADVAFSITRAAETSSLSIYLVALAIVVVAVVLIALVALAKRRKKKQ